MLACTGDLWCRLHGFQPGEMLRNRVGAILGEVLVVDQSVMNSQVWIYSSFTFRHEQLIVMHIISTNFPIYENAIEIKSL